jgi:hypothetical protein
LKNSDRDRPGRLKNFNRDRIDPERFVGCIFSGAAVLGGGAGILSDVPSTHGISRGLPSLLTMTGIPSGFPDSAHVIR